MICNRWAKAEVSVSDLKMLDGGVAAVGNTAAIFKVGLRERGEPALQLQDIFLKFQLYIAEFVAVDANRKAVDLPEKPVHLVFSYLLHLLMKLVYLAQTFYRLSLLCEFTMLVRPLQKLNSCSLLVFC